MRAITTKEFLKMATTKKVLPVSRVKSISVLKKLDLHNLNNICKQQGVPLYYQKAEKVKILGENLGLTFDVQDVISSLSTAKDVLSLQNRELSAVSKRLGLSLTGSKEFRVTAVCEKLGISTCSTPDDNKENVCSWIDDARKQARTEEGWTKDIRKMPPISLQDVTEYLLDTPKQPNKSINVEIFSKEKLLRYKTLRSYRLWKEGHIHSLMYHEFRENVALVRCISLASFEKQGTQYNTFVAISKKTRKILYGHCLCIAGLGETCTHVAGLLFAIEEFVSEGLSELPDNLTCTEKLCKWIVPKGPTETPRLIKDITFSKIYPCKTNNNNNNNNNNNKVIKDPRAQIDRSVNDTDLSVLYHNLKAIDSDAPIVQIIQSYLVSQPSSMTSNTILSPTLQFSTEVYDLENPVLIPSAEVQVESLPPTMKDRVDCIIATDERPQILTAGILVVNEDYIKSVEKLTQGQSDNPNWKIYRQHVCTASNILSVCTRVDSVIKGRVNDGGAVLKKILGTSEFFGTESTTYGLNHEDHARKAYTKLKSKEHCNFTCIQPGFIYHVCGYVGASPDGICSCDCHHERYLIEIKCPMCLKDKDPNTHAVELDCLTTDENGCIKLRESHKYYYQVMATMGVTNTRVCEVVIWSPKGMLVVEVMFDANKFIEILTKSKLYFEWFVLPTLL